MTAHLWAGACGGVTRHAPEMPDVPDDSPGLRAANGRLRELRAERDAEIGLLREQVPTLQVQIADLATQVKANSRNSSKPPSSLR
jgi:Family of unknown function (DUF6444)